MDKVTEKKVLIKALCDYGQEKQVDICIEEMAELAKALLKYRRDPKESTWDNIIEELEDVHICLDQMGMLFGRSENFREKKLQRLGERIGFDFDIM